MKSFCRIPVLILALSSFAHGQGLDIRMSGEYASGTRDTPETARQLATLDAGFKALEKAAASLGDLPSVKSLRLTESQLAAYVSGIAEFGMPDSKAEGNVFKSEVVLHLDPADAGRRIQTLHEDPEASLDLMEALKGHRQLREKLAQDNLTVRNATAADLPQALEARQRTIARLQAGSMLAQARFVLARHELGPASARVLSDDGRRLGRQLVERALAIDATNPHAHRVLGDLLLLEDRPDQAEKEFREALKANPNSNVDHNKLGNAILEQGTRLEESIAEFREAIRLNPTDKISHADLGLILRAQQNSSAAVSEYREALRIDPDYVDAHNYLGIALATEGQIAEALAEFREIIRILPNSSLGHFNAATALADLEKDEEAAKELRETVRLNPGHYNAHYNLGEMLRLLGELEESAKEFREYVKRAPDNPGTRRNKERANTFIKAFEEQ